MNYDQIYDTIQAVPNVHNFLENLAGFLRNKYGSSPLGFQRSLVILPTRRSCTQLKEILVKNTSSHAIIPPYITTFSDLRDLPALHQIGSVPTDWQSLIQLIDILNPLLFSSHSMSAVLHYAQTLKSLLEEWKHHQLSMKDLESIAPHNLAGHLQDNLRLFYAALEQFPATHLKAYQQETAFNAVLDKLEGTPLLIASDALPDPQTIGFLTACSKRPDTHIFLLGFDPQVDLSSIKLQPYHPQYSFMKFLKKSGIQPAKVTIFQPDLASSDLIARQKLLLRVFGDDQLTHPEVAKYVAQDALKRVKLIECSTLHEEAMTIAIILREALETPHQKAALITSDRHLAGQVKAQLRRWELEIDDSAGEPLFETPTGTFLKLTAECILSDFAPLPLLSLLKHPYAALQRSPIEIRKLARQFERTILRQSKFISHNLTAWQQATDNEEVQSLLNDLEVKSNHLQEMIRQPVVSLKQLLNAHLEFAITLATSLETDGRQVLFKGEIGESIFQTLEKLLQASENFPLFKPRDYLGVFIQLLHGVRVRKTYGYHPRLFILDPMQARLQDFDCVILGNLNAGNWPQQSSTDPWFSQEMRKVCGLPTLAHHEGIAAQQFINILSAPRIILTRAQKVSGSISLASPWLQRLQTALKAHQQEDILTAEVSWTQWQRQIDAPETYSPLARPRPQPPLINRPRELSVTDVERLLEDPYAIYVRKILKIRPLSPLEAETEGALFGTLVHQIMDQFFAHQAPSESLLLHMGETLFLPFQKTFPVFYGLYWPKFRSLASWIFEQYKLEEDLIAKTYTEVSGYLELEAPGGPFELTAIADRIDLMKDGTLRIIDYKTGVLPTVRQLQQGGRPQLLLEALIAEKGRFTGVQDHSVRAIEYWQLGRHPQGGERLGISNDLRRHIEEMFKRLEALIAFYDHPNANYQPSWNAAAFCPYSQLARRYEWSTAIL